MNLFLLPVALWVWRASDYCNAIGERNGYDLLCSFMCYYCKLSEWLSFHLHSLELCGRHEKVPLIETFKSGQFEWFIGGSEKVAVLEIFIKTWILFMSGFGEWNVFAMDTGLCKV